MVEPKSKSGKDAPTTPTNIRRKLEGEKSVKGTKLNIGMVGNSDVGKTSLIKRFVYGEKFDPRGGITTIGMD